MADQASPFIMDIKNIFYAAVKQSNSWVTEMNIFLKAQKLKAKPLIKQALGRLKTSVKDLLKWQYRFSFAQCRNDQI